VPQQVRIAAHNPDPWESLRGPSVVSDVCNSLSDRLAYTTVLTVQDSENVRG